MVPSGIFPVEVRPAGQGVTISIALAVSFPQSADAGVHRPALRHEPMKYTTFLFYVGWILITTALVAALLPETKRVPLEPRRSGAPCGRGTGTGEGLPATPSRKFKSEIGTKLDGWYIRHCFQLTRWDFERIWSSRNSNSTCDMRGWKHVLYLILRTRHFGPSEDFPQIRCCCFLKLNLIATL